MRRPLVSRALALAGVLLPACDSPTQPIVEFGQGVTIYQHSLFRGESVTLGGDVSDFSDLRGPCNYDSDPVTGGSGGNFDDCVSSIRVPDGWTVVVFRDNHWKGASVTYTSDVPDLDMVPGPCDPGFNDCISSIHVFRR